MTRTNIITCNRCEATTAFSLGIMPDWMIVTHQFLDLDHDEISLPGTIDLCPKCANEFQQWMLKK